MATELESKFQKLNVVEPASITEELDDIHDDNEESERELTVELREGLDLRYEYLFINTNGPR